MDNTTCTELSLKNAVHSSTKLTLLIVCILFLTSQVARADHTANPSSVTIAGDLQAMLGCPGDWQPPCSNTYLTYLDTADVWRGSFNIVAGNYQYKAALDDSWNENYGINASSGGANIPLSVAADTPVNFYYDHKTHWVTDNINSRIAIAAGDFQTFLGCTGPWQPDCLNSWLQDIDGDGIYTLVTSNIPAGDYQAKVTIDESWSENYGDGGAANGSNILFSIPENDTEVVFSFDSSTNILRILIGGLPNGSLSKARAHWLSADVLAWDADISDTDKVYLHASSDAQLALTVDGVTGGEQYELTANGGLSAELQSKYPHLANYTAVLAEGINETVKRALLKSQLALSVIDENGKLKDATAIQAPGVLDDLFYYDGELGSTVNGDKVTAKVWAPTAQQVELLLFENSQQLDPSQILPMTEDTSTGVWSAYDIEGWDRKFYQYRVTVYSRNTKQVEVNDVTDPYSLSLTTNSRLSQFVNLDDGDLKPRGWDYYRKPYLRSFDDISIYELHIRDFSIIDSSLKPEDQGTYNAFRRPYSNGVRHLRSLARAGLTHIHLLPTYDLASINEDKTQQVVIEQDLSLLAPDSEEQQAAVAEVQNEDGFNWGYDPFHYTVPEGSYSSNPDGVTRIKEFRGMVKSLNRKGLRVIMDVVYNHTFAAGQSDKSVLDKIVPNYYHRYNADGVLEMSTCCSNTASENLMMEKLMIDSLLVWAKAYKVDGFRFDLMGHHSKQNMLNVQSALSSLERSKDGVDGEKIYLYGEGWNFGEVANDARFEQATQLNMGGTGIATFDDRGRDAIRGGSPFSGYQDQGFGNGLFTNPNGVGDESKDTLLRLADHTRISLIGGLKDYVLETANSELLTGYEIDYNGQPTAYTDDPQELISYVAAHDNETLLDGIQAKAPASSSIIERGRMQNLSSALVLLGQGIPFIHAGQDFLRSKSLDRDSFNSGDWFNALDFTFSTSGWGRGLPIADKNQSNWPLMAPLLADETLMPKPWLMKKTSSYFQEMLRIRYSSKLFRMSDKEGIMENVSFLNTGPSQIPGLIAMRLQGKDSKGRSEEIVVLFNGSNESFKFGHQELDAKGYALHPLQRRSIDNRTRLSYYDSDGQEFFIPAMTTAVFIGK